MNRQSAGYPRRFFQPGRTAARPARGRASRCPSSFFDRSVEVEDRRPVRAERRMQPLDLRVRKLRQAGIPSFPRAPPPRRPRGGPRGRAGTPAQDQVVGKVGGKQGGIGNGGQAALAVEGHAPHRAFKHLGANRGLVETVEYRRLVLLKVAVVGHGKPLHEGQQRVEVALEPRGLPPEKLARVGILLLGHEGASRAETVRQGHKSKLGAAPKDCRSSAIRDT